jgi:hypothetical protein
VKAVPDPPVDQRAAQVLLLRVFKDEAAFADHQQTDHFKTLIVGQAVPKLAKRERTHTGLLELIIPVRGGRGREPQRRSQIQIEFKASVASSRLP